MTPGNVLAHEQVDGQRQRPPPEEGACSPAALRRQGAARSGAARQAALVSQRARPRAGARRRAGAGPPTVHADPVPEGARRCARPCSAAAGAPKAQARPPAPGSATGKMAAAPAALPAASHSWSASTLYMQPSCTAAPPGSAPPAAALSAPRASSTSASGPAPPARGARRICMALCMAPDPYACRAQRGRRVRRACTARGCPVQGRPRATPGVHQLSHEPPCWQRTPLLKG